MYKRQDSERDFGEWIKAYDWSAVMAAKGSNAKAETYQEIVTAAIRTFFPTITTRRKSTDLPWINSYIRRQIRRRHAIFREHGRSDRWHRQKIRTDNLIKVRRDKYFEVQKKIILAEDGSRVFFKNVRRYKSADKPSIFDVRSCLLYTSPSPRD